MEQSESNHHHNPPTQEAMLPPPPSKEENKHGEKAIKQLQACFVCGNDADCSARFCYACDFLFHLHPNRREHKQNNLSAYTSRVKQNSSFDTALKDSSTSKVQQFPLKGLSQIKSCQNDVHASNMPEPSDGTTWTCEFCTFVNGISDLSICHVCCKTNSKLLAAAAQKIPEVKPTIETLEETSTKLTDRNKTEEDFALSSESNSLYEKFWGKDKKSASVSTSNISSTSSSRELPKSKQPIAPKTLKSNDNQTVVEPQQELPTVDEVSTVHKEDELPSSVGASSVWICGFCTLANESTVNICNVCSKSKNVNNSELNVPNKTPQPTESSNQSDKSLVQSDIEDFAAQQENAKNTRSKNNKRKGEKSFLSKIFATSSTPESSTTTHDQTSEQRRSENYAGAVNSKLDHNKRQEENGTPNINKTFQHNALPFPLLSNPSSQQPTSSSTYYVQNTDFVPNSNPSNNTGRNQEQSPCQRNPEGNTGAVVNTGNPFRSAQTRTQQCDGSHKNSYPSQSEASQQSAEYLTPSALWTCKHCSMINEGGIRIYVVCGKSFGYVPNDDGRIAESKLLTSARDSYQNHSNNISKFNIDLSEDALLHIEDDSGHHEREGGSIPFEGLHAKFNEAAISLPDLIPLPAPQIPMQSTINPFGDKSRPQLAGRRNEAQTRTGTNNWRSFQDGTTAEQVDAERAKFLTIQQVLQQCKEHVFPK